MGYHTRAHRLHLSRFHGETIQIMPIFVGKRLASLLSDQARHVAFRHLARAETNASSHHQYAQTYHAKNGRHSS